MSESKVRKAVVTLAQVQTAFSAYAGVKAEIGTPVSGHSFDKGPRGRGFAEYDAADSIVRTFEGKEDALTFYSRYTEVAREVIDAPLVSLTKPTESDAETPEVPAQRKASKTSKTSKTSA
jgi:hypothetical protein